MQKRKIKHKKMSGRIISIFEEKNRSKLNIMLDTSKMEVDVKKEEYKVGDDITMDVNIEITKTEKNS